jgi:hypothetical protein
MISAGCGSSHGDWVSVLCQACWWRSAWLRSCRPCCLRRRSRLLLLRRKPPHSQAMERSSDRLHAAHGDVALQ